MNVIADAIMEVSAKKANNSDDKDIQDTESKIEKIATKGTALEEISKEKKVEVPNEKLEETK